MDRTGAVLCSSVGAIGGKPDNNDLIDRLAQKKNLILTALQRNHEKGIEVLSARGSHTQLRVIQTRQEEAWKDFKVTADNLLDLLSLQ